METVLAVVGIGNDLMKYRKSDASNCERGLQNLCKRVLLLSNSPLTYQLGKTKHIQKLFVCLGSSFHLI